MQGHCDSKSGLNDVSLIMNDDIPMLWRIDLAKGISAGFASLSRKTTELGESTGKEGVALARQVSPTIVALPLAWANRFIYRHLLHTELHPDSLSGGQDTH